jgi:hypothetical protein
MSSALPVCRKAVLSDITIVCPMPCTQRHTTSNGKHSLPRHGATQTTEKHIFAQNITTMPRSSSSCRPAAKPVLLFVLSLAFCLISANPSSHHFAAVEISENGTFAGQESVVVEGHEPGHAEEPRIAEEDEEEEEGDEMDEEDFEEGEWEEDEEEEDEF